MSIPVVDIVTAVLLLSGATMALTAAIGVLRFPDTLSRMHSATKPQTFGLLLILIGAMIQVGRSMDTGMLVLTCLFMLCTAPVVAHRIGRLVYQEQRARDGLIEPEQMEQADRD